MRLKSCHSAAVATGTDDHASRRSSRVASNDRGRCVSGQSAYACFTVWLLLSLPQLPESAWSL